MQSVKSRASGTRTTHVLHFVIYESKTSIEFQSNGQENINIQASDQAFLSPTIEVQHSTTEVMSTLCHLNEELPMETIYAALPPMGGLLGTCGIAK